VSFENLHAEAVGEIEVQSEESFHLTADESDCETIERVLEVYAEGCPVAASVKERIEVSSELALTVV
jgi:uncharacterized OsmC-like protein